MARRLTEAGRPLADFLEYLVPDDLLVPAVTAHEFFDNQLDLERVDLFLGVLLGDCRNLRGVQ
jgi:hypothetical protein